MKVRWRRDAGMAMAIALAAVGCSDGDKSGSSSTSRTQPPATSTTTTAMTTLNTCGDDPVGRDDDIPATDALLAESQLPAGEWTRTSTCRWTFSGEDLLAIPACAALTGDVATAKEQHTGYARATWSTQDDRVLLDHRVELYGSPRAPKLVDTLFTGRPSAGCFTAAFRSQAARLPRTTLDDVQVRGRAVAVDRRKIGVEFVGAVDVTMTVVSDGQRTPMAVRVIAYRIGGGLGIVSFVGAGSAGTIGHLDTIDDAATVRAAASQLRAIFGL